MLVTCFVLPCFVSVFGFVVCCVCLRILQIFVAFGLICWLVSYLFYLFVVRLFDCLIFCLFVFCCVCICLFAFGFAVWFYL